MITDDVPMASTRSAAGAHIKLLMLVNDVSLRNLIPGELTKGFGFFQGKPSTAFSPVALTPDELGEGWDGAKLHRKNLRRVGGLSLIAHAARTRRLTAGSIVGSGTVSNDDPDVGSSCLAERRMIEIIETGEAKTPFLSFGDRVRIEMLDAEGRSVFGAIEHEVVRYTPPT